MIKVIVRAVGATGLSAYQDAVREGFAGSLADWLDYLRQPSVTAAADAVAKIAQTEVARLAALAAAEEADAKAAAANLAATAASASASLADEAAANADHKATAADTAAASAVSAAGGANAAAANAIAAAASLTDAILQQLGASGGGPNITTADYIVQPTDEGALIVVNSATPRVVWVDANLPPGFDCEVVKAGAGNVILRSGTASVNAPGGLVALTTRFASARLRSIGLNAYLVQGGQATDPAFIIARTLFDRPAASGLALMLFA